MKLDRLTEILLVHNIDGIHTESQVLGYIADEPFCVLSMLLSKYFICGYNEELYKMAMVPYKYALYIRDVGNRYNSHNSSKFQYHDTENFILDSDFIYRARVASYSEKYRKAYLNMLDDLRDNVEDIQKAINCQTIVDYGYIDPVEIKTKPDFLKKRLDVLSTLDIPDDSEVLKLYCSVVNHIVFSLTINDI